jgi:hypothetical protein
MKNTISHLDGWLYVAIGVCPVLIAELSTKDALEVMSVKCLFWSRLIIITIGAAAGAGKTYRSTNFADKKDQDKAIDKAENPDKYPLTADNPSVVTTETKTTLS